jgi:8-amino-7-oxononanoate synthase
VREQPERRERLHALVRYANEMIAARCEVAGSGSQIIPVVVGASGRAMELAAALQARGFDIRGIRPPTVPEGTARLRLSITLNVDEATVERVVEALAAELARLPA